ALCATGISNCKTKYGDPAASREEFFSIKKLTCAAQSREKHFHSFTPLSQGFMQIYHYRPAVPPAGRDFITHQPS
ncbi:MAG: hypothetical protein JXQ83_14870, partial [Candidatus Glassbacteria bacterium]|nr:hypothetical protein [Candidatus Glassbacteria bacterium]